MNHLVAYGRLYLVVNDGYFQQQLHGGSFQLGQYALLYNLFDNERNSHNQVRLHFGESLENDFGAGHTSEEEYVATYGEFIQKLECKSVHMCHWQHGDNLVTGFQRQYFESKSGV